MFIILFHILCYDLWYYFAHTLIHKRNFYWIHKKHHFNKELTFLDAYEAHIIETPLESVGIVFSYVITNYTTYEFLWACVLLNLRTMLKHDPRGSWLVGNHHLLHHKYPNYNFGEYWIDSLCNTKYPNDKEYIHGYICT